MNHWRKTRIAQSFWLFCGILPDGEATSSLNVQQFVVSWPSSFHVVIRSGIYCFFHWEISQFSILVLSFLISVSVLTCCFDVSIHLSPVEVQRGDGHRDPSFWGQIKPKPQLLNQEPGTTWCKTLDCLGSCHRLAAGSRGQRYCRNHMHVQSI